MTNQCKKVKGKPKVEVFVTKSSKFRAKINNYVDPPYEVTINGDSWKNGKGIEYRNQIIYKIELLVSHLKYEWEEVYK